MKIYIAAPYPLRDEGIAAMKHLEAQGHTVTSRWLIDLAEDSAHVAQEDLRDVAAADILLMLHPEGWHDKGTGGRHVEMGYALALGKQIILIGERTNVFHHLPNVSVLDQVDDL